MVIKMKLKKTLCGVMALLTVMSATPVFAADKITICFDWSSDSAFVDYTDNKTVSDYTGNISNLPDNIIGWAIVGKGGTLTSLSEIDESMCGTGEYSDLIWLEAIYDDETAVDGVIFSWNDGAGSQYISPFEEGKTLSYYAGKLTGIPDEIEGWKVYGSTEKLAEDAILDESMLFEDEKVIWLEAVYKKTEPEKEDNGGFNWILIDELNKKIEITATAGEGGRISPEGTTEYKRGEKPTYTFTADKGYEIASVSVNGEEKGAVSEYTFDRLTKNQTISVTFKKSAVQEWENPFTDVDEKDSFYEAVRFVYENGLFKGVSETEFAPETTMTRAMFVTILGRLAKVDVSKYEGKSFDDVVEGEYYAPYVEWAVGNGIANGYGDGKFGVNDEVTIEQAIVFISRYAKLNGVETDTAIVDFDEFKDIDSVSEWAFIETLWALESGVYTADDGMIDPQGNAVRSLVAEMLSAYCGRFGN